jgi:hypothetical protein
MAERFTRRLTFLKTEAIFHRALPLIRGAFPMHKPAIQPKQPIAKDAAWRRAALRYSLLILIIGAIAGTCLGVQIAAVEATEAEQRP